MLEGEERREALAALRSLLEGEQHTKRGATLDSLTFSSKKGAEDSQINPCNKKQRQAHESRPCDSRPRTERGRRGCLSNPLISFQYHTHLASHHYTAGAKTHGSDLAIILRFSTQAQ
jgi:hypothetical protein